MSGPVWTYAFRMNASTTTHDRIIQMCSYLAKNWCFQKERGEETGYEHYQGTFSLKQKKRKSELMTVMEHEGFQIPNYLEPAHSRAGAFDYSMKDDTRIEGPWKDTDKEPTFVPYHLEGLSMRPWQQAILDSGRIENRNPRCIDVIVDPPGNNGKSLVASHAALTGQGIIAPPVNDGDKLIQAMCSLCSARRLRDPKIVFFDLPRALPKDRLAGMMNGIEQIKSGRLYDLRYHTTEWWIHPPRVWVFTNRVPNASDLSRDRWRYWQINALGTLSTYVPTDVPSEPEENEWAPE